MADITQSATQTILAHQLMTHGTDAVKEGTPVAVASWVSGVITAKIANIETTANADGVIVRILGSFETSGDDAWFPLLEFEGSETAAETEALTAIEPVGETTLAVASTTNLVVNDVIYVQDASVVADGEWHIITDVVTNTSIDIDFGLAVQKDSSDFIFTEADIFKASIDCTGLARVNVLILHPAATGSNLHILVEGKFFTDIE